MRIFALLAFLILFFPITSRAQGCPAGQYPIGGQGAVACAPMPQSSSAMPQEPRPLGKWIKTWGAIALGTIDSTPYYGVPTGALSESEAKQQSLERCAKLGAKNCRVTLTYQNQCAAISEPQFDGKPNPDGLIQFIGRSTKAKASEDALHQCEKRNPGMQCKAIYQECSELVFKNY
ncbi:hypothetical protein GGR74_002649 [Xanthomonas arboricola]